MRVNIDDTDMDKAQRFTYDGELFTGEVVETDRDGNVIGLTTVRDGIPHGPDLGWYPDGTLEGRTTVVDGMVVGVSSHWHPNGRLAEEREFDDRGQLVDVRRWREDGTPILTNPPRRAYVYFGAMPAGRTRANPAGVVRRSQFDGTDVDEAFTRNLRWEPTTALLERRFGHGDTEYVEISEAEAQQVVDRITEKLGPRPAG